MRIALLHYSYPPVIGGVEEVMAQHARLFRRAGHEVKIVCGQGEGEGVVAVPELRSGGEGVDAERLRHVLGPQDAVFAHNVLHMHFNLALTAAVWELASAGGTRWVSWIHDLAAVNPDYELGERPAMELLRKAHPEIDHVAVSSWRREQFVRLTGDSRCEWIPNGIDPVEMLRLTPRVAGLVEQLDLFRRDLVILHPARVLRRKNLEAGIRLVAELERRGSDAVHLITAPPDPHNPSAAAYGSEMAELAGRLGVRERVVWVSGLFPVTKSDLISLYGLAHMVLFPSRHEGFGLPLLEAGLLRVPFLSAGGAREILPEAVVIDADEDPVRLADRVEAEILNLRGARIRRRVLREYTWSSIYETRLAPLLRRFG